MSEDKGHETRLRECLLLDATGRSCSPDESQFLSSVRSSMNQAPRLANWSDVWEVAKTIERQGVGTTSTSR